LKEEKDGTEDERTIFVGNLPISTTRKSLKRLFQDCGNVESCRIRSIGASGVKLQKERAGDRDLMLKVCANTGRTTVKKNSCQGYVVFATQEGPAQALKKNNTRISGDDGVNHTLRVDTVKPTVDHSRTLFLGNLPYSTTEDEIRKFFSNCNATIEGVRVVRDRDTMQCRGVAYVLFRDQASVAAGLRFNKKIFKKKEIRVSVCFKNPGKKKKRAMAAGKGLNSTSALRRVGNKAKNTKKANKASRKPIGQGGISKRKATDTKVKNRVKKLEKRVKKGMGKNKKL